MHSTESRLRSRARIIKAVRFFFYDNGYTEVETPNLIPAPAPEVHIDALQTSLGFLHPSPELCMKRLLAAGCPEIFQICKCYRPGERGRLHLPEFTLLEWYRPGADYTDLMDECEEMIRHVLRELDRGDKFRYGDDIIDLKGPWERLTVAEAFQHYSSLDVKTALASDRFDEIMVSEIEPSFNRHRPVFLYDYPAELSALARLKGDDPSVAERFELFIGGLELANAFSELTDPVEQETRFKEDMAKRRILGKSEYPFPDRFIKDLYHMPPCAGIAFGIDRFVMLLTNSESIDEVVSFTPEKL